MKVEFSVGYTKMVGSVMQDRKPFQSEDYMNKYIADDMNYVLIHHYVYYL